MTQNHLLLATFGLLAACAPELPKDPTQTVLDDLSEDDDYQGPGSTGDTYTFDSVTGEGEIHWFWNDCCTDGMALGYLQGEACVTLSAEAIVGIVGIRVWDSPSSNVALPPDASFSICGTL